MSTVDEELLKYVRETSDKDYDKILLLGNDLDLLAAELKPKSIVSAVELDPSAHEKDSCDLIIAKGNISDFSEDRLDAFLDNTLRILKIGGRMLVRPNMNKASKSMPYYTNCFDLYRTESGAGFELCWLKPLDSSIENSNNWHDFCWCLKKANFGNSEKNGIRTLRSFLDAFQYSVDGILAYEWIYGRGFISPGALDENRKFLSRLGPKVGQVMLDIGSGLGGGVAQAAREFKTAVVGIDLSSNMIQMAIDRAQEANDPRVRYMLADVMKYEFPANHFDTIYSRECIAHIADKELLFERLYRWLKPGGKLMLICVISGSEHQTADFKAYIDSRKYTLLSVSRHVEACKLAGFENVVGTDMGDRLNQFLHIEIEAAERNKQQFLKRFTESQYDCLLSGWRDKIVFMSTANLSWMMIEGSKPAID